MAVKLSIVTICYNEKYIAETCVSVVSQTWRDFEWIVVDGGSTDGTLEILDRYRNDITTLISEKDHGIYNAMNKGIRLAKGEWLLFLNGGDSFYAHDSLEKMFNFDFADFDIVYGDTIQLSNNGLFAVTNFKERKLDPAYFYSNIIPHQGSLIRRGLFDKYGMYNEARKIAADWEQWIIFAKNACRFRKIAVPVACFRKNGISENPQFNDLHRSERNAVLQLHYSEEETRSALEEKVRNNHYHFIYQLVLFGLIPLFSIKRTGYGHKSRCYCFTIPVLEIRHFVDGSNQVKLFGCIPLLTFWQGKCAYPKFVK